MVVVDGRLVEKLHVEDAQRPLAVADNSRAKLKVACHHDGGAGAIRPHSAADGELPPPNPPEFDDGMDAVAPLDRAVANFVGR